MQCVNSFEKDGCHAKSKPIINPFTVEQAMDDRVAGHAKVLLSSIPEDRGYG
jgi:hypothetical protein